MFTASVDRQLSCHGETFFATEWKVVGRQERVRAGGREGEGDAPCPPLESSLRRLAPWRRREDVIPVTCSPPRSLDAARM